MALLARVLQSCLFCVTVFLIYVNDFVPQISASTRVIQCYICTMYGVTVLI